LPSSTAISNNRASHLAPPIQHDDIFSRPIHPIPSPSPRKEAAKTAATTVVVEPIQVEPIQVVQSEEETTSRCSGVREGMPLVVACVCQHVWHRFDNYFQKKFGIVFQKKFGIVFQKKFGIVVDG